MTWKIKLGCEHKAFQKFLTTGAPFPGVKMHGRYHAPGSGTGWIILETDNLSAVYEHAANWIDVLEWSTMPVLTDEQAGKAAAKEFPQFLG